MAGLETLDGPLLRVPFESLKRAAKDRKAVIDEAAECLAALKHPLTGTSSAQAAPAAVAATPSAGQDPSRSPSMGAEARSSPAEGAAAAASEEDTEMVDACTTSAPGPSGNCREASIERLRLLLSQLQGVKRKLADVSKSELGDCQRCKARLEHLATTGPPPKDAKAGGLIAWTRQRLDILLVDHLLRLGHHETAHKLAAASGIELLTDANVFEDARRVLSALLQDHDCGPALAWCHEHRSRLKKVKSVLEFKLHVQQFIELVRRDDRLGAIAYARQHLAPWATTHMAELQRAVATLAFTARTRVEVYRALFDSAAWRGLADLFLQDLYRMHALTPEPLLAVYLQAGLSALKTPSSGEEGGSREDPLSLPAFQRLAACLPYAKHTRSKLVCAVTREIMTDANPPMVLPNGLVYSTRGVELLIARQQAQQQQAQQQQAQQQAQQAAGGAGSGGSTGGAAAASTGAGAATGAGGACLVCPRTGMVFRRDELRRAFIV